MTRRSYVLLALLLVACGGGRKPPGGPLEQRVVTAGASLYEHLPARADVVLELDVARLRRNETIGPLVRALAPWLRAHATTDAIAVDLPLDADMIVAAVYDLGGDDAAMLVLVRGAAIDAGAVASAASDLTRVDEHTFAYGPPALRAQTPAPAPALAEDAAFLRLRDRAMPERAPGAALRLTARLSRAARIGAAGRLGYDGALPASVSLWADVADDVALVALLDGDDAGQANQLAADIDAGVPRLGRYAGVPVKLRRVRTTVADTRVRVVWTIGPKALADTIERFASRQAEAPAP
jgi:hypothetical protein